MKKFFITLIAFCGLALQANADVTLYVGPTTLLAGAQSEVAIHIKSDQAVQSFQGVVTLPAGLTFTGDAVENLDFRGEGEKCDMFGGSPVEEGQKMNVVVLSAKTPIPAGDVIIAIAPVEAAADIALEDYSVSVSNLKVVFEDDTDTGLIVDAGETTVTVADKLVLDETADFISAANGSTADVTVNRTIKAGEWNSIVLPFKVTADQATEIFGADAELAQFSGFTVESDEDYVPQAIEINFSAYTPNKRTGIPAGTPFIVKPVADITSFAVAGVTFSKSVVEKEIVSSEGDEWTAKMTGTFVKSVVPEDGLFIADNKFYYSVGKTAIKGFRTWIESDAILNKEAAEVKFFVDGISTGIQELAPTTTTRSDAVYTLDGKLAGRNLSSLKKGIYVVNGKKVVK